MTKITDFCDFFVIASAASHRQVHALAEAIEEALFQKGIRLFRCQNDSEFSWVVLDFFDVVVHIFFAPIREYYNLERLWADAKKIEFKT
jgi:ribosome-associated protein